MSDFLALRLGEMLRYVRGESVAYWCACGYIFVEYFRPQSIYPALQVIPWGQAFILGAVAGVLADRTIRPTWNAAHAWVLAYLGLVVISSYLAIFPAASWARFADYFNWVIIYFVLVHVLNSERRLFFALLIFVLAGLKMSFHGARTWAMRGFGFTNWGLMGPEGPFQNSGELSVQMLVYAPIGLCLWIVTREHCAKWKQYVFIAMPVTAAMTIVGASSRGAQLALAVQGVLALVLRRTSVRTLMLAAAAVTLLVTLMPDAQWERFRSAGEDETSQQRMLYWQRGMEMIERYPTLGVGYYNFAPYFATHYPDDIILRRAELPHNIFIQVGTDTGLIGLVVFSLILASSFLATRSTRRLLAERPGHWVTVITYGYDAALVGFIIAGQFVTIAYYPFLWINLAFAVATRSVAHGLVSSQTAASTRRRRGDKASRSA